MSNYPFCSGKGTSVDPYILEDIYINGYQGNYCLGIQNSQVEFTVRNCHFYNMSGFWVGLYLSNVINGYIINNEFYDNDGNGIELYLSDYNIINFPIST